MHGWETTRLHYNSYSVIILQFALVHVIHISANLQRQLATSLSLESPVYCPTQDWSTFSGSTSLTSASGQH